MPGTVMSGYGSRKTPDRPGENIEYFHLAPQKENPNSPFRSSSAKASLVASTMSLNLLAGKLSNWEK